MNQGYVFFCPECQNYSRISKSWQVVDVLEKKILNTYQGEHIIDHFDEDGDAISESNGDLIEPMLHIEYKCFKCGELVVDPHGVPITDDDELRVYLERQEPCSIHPHPVRLEDEEDVVEEVLKEVRVENEKGQEIADPELLP